MPTPPTTLDLRFARYGPELRACLDAVYADHGQDVLSRSSILSSLIRSYEQPH